MNEINLKALAKINLGLDVTGIREDGYHEVSMIMQTINLYDRITVKIAKADGIFIETNVKYIPVGPKNLCYKAAQLLMEEFNITQGVKIKIDKHIPVAAGMAGGSTDAAAVLYAINKLFDLGLNKKQLMERGVKIGADVPYCLMRGTALAEGIGEKLSPIHPMMKCFVLIAKPPVDVSTKQVYTDLDAKFDKVKHPDIPALIKDIESQDLKSLCLHMGNVLEEVTIPLHPEIARIKNIMMENGAAGSMMSGSGPTVFGLFESETTAYDAKAKLTESGLCRNIYVTTVFNNK
ncbi:MAG: 4-(cytidine 5'-diphospho)-2-C-methyl-D-erythritol kinase [Pseudobutyrivibrio sp.]|nr:4-(cytidine 5'-diphospho)-2-C-methyl-D-erythritol kinase [Pseudobutyrivibrio sp.]